MSVALNLGCSRRSPDRTDLGSTALTFAIPGIEILTAHFEITGNGFSRSGDIDVSAPNASLTALVSGIPAGTGYVVTIDATSTDGRTVCHGTGTFDVVAATTSRATVQLLCHTNLDLGTVAISGSFRQCPHIESITASSITNPMAAQEVIDLHASATDPENDPLAVTWSATAGNFDTPTALNTIYRCAAPGPVTLTLRVSDGGCADMVTAPLICRPPCFGRLDGTPCSDDNACTQLDTCQGQMCVGSNPVVCSALDQCHVAGVCDTGSGVCSNPSAPNGTTCAVPNASAGCQMGACAITSCFPGFDNCNGVSSDGCETNLNTDASCGACFRACGAGTHCNDARRCLSPAPANLAAAPGGWKNKLAWSASPGATSYEVRRATSSAGPFSAIGTALGTSFVDLRVLGATSYVYAVAAINPEGTGAPSAPIAATTVTKQLCVNSNPMSAVFAFGANQSGAAAPLRTIGGSFITFPFPDAVASSLMTDELFVIRRGTRIDVYPLAASGNVPPLRTLTVPGSAAVTYALDVDGAAGRVYKVDYQPPGRLLIMDATTGVPIRTVSGADTGFGNVPSLVVDAAHGEILVGVANTSSSRVETFDIAGPSGNVAPKRVLGAPGNTAVGNWAIALDRSRDQILTSCNCDDRITVFGRTTVGDAAPVRSLRLPGVLGIYSLLMDEAADTMWALARIDATTNVLVELPRGGSGDVTALHPGITFMNPGRIAPCN